MAGLDALLSTLHPPSRENRRMTRSRTGSLHLRSYGTSIRYSLLAFTGAFPDPFSSSRSEAIQLFASAPLINRRYQMPRKKELRGGSSFDYRPASPFIFLSKSPLIDAPTQGTILEAMIS